jgi:hypothetical protein
VIKNILSQICYLLCTEICQILKKKCFWGRISPHFNRHFGQILTSLLLFQHFQQFFCQLKLNLIWDDTKHCYIRQLRKNVCVLGGNDVFGVIFQKFQLEKSDFNLFKAFLSPFQFS